MGKYDRLRMGKYDRIRMLSSEEEEERKEEQKMLYHLRERQYGIADSIRK